MTHNLNCAVMGMVGEDAKQQQQRKRMETTTIRRVYWVERTRGQEGEGRGTGSRVRGASGRRVRLEAEGSALGLLVATQLEVLAALQGDLGLVFTQGALKSEDNLLGGLGLLVEDGLGLTTETGLLAVVSALAYGCVCVCDGGERATDDHILATFYCEAIEISTHIRPTCPAELSSPVQFTSYL
jgi:hypothetical protein